MDGCLYSGKQISVCDTVPSLLARTGHVPDRGRREDISPLPRVVPTGLGNGTCTSRVTVVRARSLVHSLETVSTSPRPAEATDTHDTPSGRGVPDAPTAPLSTGPRVSLTVLTTPDRKVCVGVGFPSAHVSCRGR